MKWSLKGLFARKEQQPPTPGALGNTRIHVTHDIPGQMGVAISDMLMNEIDYYFSIPAVQQRVQIKFAEIVKLYGSKK